MTEAFPEVVRDLAPTGRLRATINLGNVVLAQQDQATGTLGGVSVDLAKELGRRLGLEVELFPFDTAGKAFAALQSGTCDVGFLAIDPARAAELEFTAPYATGALRRAKPLSLDEFTFLRGVTKATPRNDATTTVSTWNRIRSAAAAIKAYLP